MSFILPSWKNDEGQLENNGRCNLGVVTLNIEAATDIFDMQLLHDALVYRIERLQDAIPDNAPILYKSGAFKNKLTSEDTVESLFTNQRATISMGYIGLYEAATLFYGPNWEHNPEAKTFTLDILREMKRYQVEWTKQYDIWFSIYSTPSESLTDRFCRLDKDKFGSIPDVTDKGYYQNSFHYDVRKDVTPFEN